MRFLYFSLILINFNIRNPCSNSSLRSRTDYQYNASGSHLAVSDSEGNVHVYQRQGDSYKKVSQFSG